MKSSPLGNSLKFVYAPLQIDRDLQKFDSLTRRHRDHGVLSFFGDIALLLIDEVHLLSDPRGAALEAVVSRMKMLSRYPELKGCPIASIRMMAVSATIANIEDLGIHIFSFPAYTALPYCAALSEVAAPGFDQLTSALGCHSGS